MKITLKRWPWQKGYSFSDMRKVWTKRFGGGWAYKLGVQISGSQVVIDLLFGSIDINFNKRHDTPVIADLMRMNAIEKVNKSNA